MKKAIVEISGLTNGSQRARVRRAVTSALKTIPSSHKQHKIAHSRPWTISIAFISPARMKALNAKYRRKNRPTDVLSYPMWQGDWVAMPGPGLLGEIYICPAIAKAQCKEWGNTYLQELERLTVHGTLHLLDYDHEKNEKQAKIMSALEEKAIRSLRG